MAHPKITIPPKIFIVHLCIKKMKFYFKYLYEKWFFSILDNPQNAHIPKYFTAKNCLPENGTHTKTLLNKINIFLITLLN